MIDPLTAFAAIKGGISAGKQLHSMSKEIAGFFDSVDGAKKAHEKKKNSLFASSNEEAMDTWMQKQQAIDAEAQLRELIVNTRGFSAWDQDLLKIRREIAKERKERERREAREREEQQELIAIIMVVLVFIIGLSAAAWWMLDYKGFI